MKRLLKATLLLVATLGLTACGGGQQPTPIEDAALLSDMNVKAVEGMKNYLDTEIPADVAFEHKGFRNEYPSPENPEEMVHYNDIFQASAVEKPAEGDIVSYGAVISPDGQITGLILNVLNDTLPVGEYTEDQLKEIVVNFLRDKQLVTADEALTFVGVNSDSSSETITVLNFDGTTNRYAVGVNLQTGTVFYYEFAPLTAFEQPAE